MALLAERPQALVAAISDDGLFVDPPPSLPFDGRTVVEGRVATDLVEPGHRELVILAWEEVLDTGRSAIDVPLPGLEGSVTVHFLDVRRTHGVFAMVLDAGDDPPPVGPVPGPSTEGMAKVVRVRKDGIAVLQHVDRSVVEVLGWEPDGLIGKRSLDLIHPDDHELAITSWMDMLAAPGLTTRARLRHARSDGAWTWLDISNTNQLDDPRPHVSCEMVDVSQEVAAQHALRTSEQVLRRLTEAMPVGVFHLDARRRVEFANAALHEILGTTPAHNPAMMMGCVVDELAFDRAISAALTGADVDTEIDVEPLGRGEVRRCTLALRCLTDDDGRVTGVVGCVTDVTESVRLRDELERRATVDDLTGCLNRASVLDALDDALGSGADVAVVFVDVDEFKLVNDGHGHAAGDEVLQAVAARLRAAVRADDTVGRMGGDEFLVVCSGLGSFAGAAELADRIDRSMRDPISFAGERLETSASVGVTWSPAGADVDADALVSRADEAMYASKGSAS